MTKPNYMINIKYEHRNKIIGNRIYRKNKTFGYLSEAKDYANKLKEKGKALDVKIISNKEARPVFRFWTVYTW